jgi:nucleotide-binding universal stress UspA family protein
VNISVKRNVEDMAKKIQPSEFKRIIVPVDGSSYAERAAKKALFLARQTGAEVIVVYVIDTPRLTNTIPPDEISRTWFDILRTQGLKVLGNIQKTAKRIHVKIETKLLEGIPSEVIMKEARKDDLIVMGCKGMTAIDRLLMGSVCENVVRHANAQVMVVR